LLLQLAKSDSNAYEAKEMVIEESIYDILSEESQVNGTEVKKELVSFGKISAETFGSPLFVNMLALGKLLTHIGINLEKVNFESLLPARNFSKNLEAIRYGYTHHLE
jgi:Pyruvate/2-oxoacid:ferredoxin oxidoreductase gamma subunit